MENMFGRHGDSNDEELKPANILVSNEPGKDFPSRLKITDFGLAKFEAADQFVR